MDHRKQIILTTRNESCNDYRAPIFGPKNGKNFNAIVKQHLWQEYRLSVLMYIMEFIFWG